MSSQPTDDDAGNTHDLPRNSQPAIGGMHSDSGLPQSGHDFVPPPLEQAILDRLQAKLEQELATTQENPQQAALDELGRELRKWRLHQGFPRAVLARKLHMDINQLVCIEDGIAWSDAIAPEQLLILKTLLSSDLSNSLQTAIEKYITLPR